MDLVNKAKEYIAPVKPFITGHKEGVLTTAAVATGTCGLYLGLTAIKIKWLVLGGLIVWTGAVAATGYVAAKELVSKLEEA